LLFSRTGQSIFCAESAVVVKVAVALSSNKPLSSLGCTHFRTVEMLAVTKLLLWQCMWNSMSCLNRIIINNTKIKAHPSDSCLYSSEETSDYELKNYWTIHFCVLFKESLDMKFAELWAFFYALVSLVQWSKFAYSATDALTLLR